MAWINEGKEESKVKEVIEVREVNSSEYEELVRLRSRKSVYESNVRKTFELQNEIDNLSAQTKELQEKYSECLKIADKIHSDNNNSRIPNQFCIQCSNCCEMFSMYDSPIDDWLRMITEHSQKCTKKTQKVLDEEEKSRRRLEELSKQI